MASKRLVGEEPVPEVLLAHRVQGPVGVLGVAEDDPHPGVPGVGVAPDVDDREQSTAASRPVDEHGHGHERSTSPRDIRSPSTERAARRGRAIPTPEPTQSRASSEDGVCDMAAAGARTAVRGAGVYCVERYGDRRLARTTAT